MANIKIRKCKTTDIDRCFNIWSGGQEESTGLRSANTKKIKKDFFNLFGHPKSIISVVITEQNVLIGWQGLFPLLDNPLLSKYTAHISTYLNRDLMVPELGQKLTEHTISVAKKKGIENIYGWVKSNNRAANLLGVKFANQKFSIKKSAQGHLPEFNLFIIDIQ